MSALRRSRRASFRMLSSTAGNVGLQRDGLPSKVHRLLRSVTPVAPPDRCSRAPRRVERVRGGFDRHAGGESLIKDTGIRPAAGPGRPAASVCGPSLVVLR
jgi:hypothetical protein